MGKTSVRIRVGVLISGGGTNLQALIDASREGAIDAEIVGVLSSSGKAYGLERARRHGIPTEVLRGKDFDSREAYDARAIEILRGWKVDLVCLAGFMRLLSPRFVAAFPGRTMNIHPSLLPSFPGLDVQQKAIEHGVRFSGCTVHFVDEGCDTGPIIIQATVPVLEDDTPERLAERILAEEHRIYPRAVQLFAQGRLRIEGRRVRIEGAQEPEGSAMHPPVPGTGAEDAPGDGGRNRN